MIAGCIAGIIPSIEFGASPAEQNRQRQEQRRLFFVGITRSTETLVLSSAVRMPKREAFRMGVRILAVRYGTATVQASPFLAELAQHAPPSITGDAWRAQVGF